MRRIAARHIDKMLHFAAYGLPAVIPALAFRRRRGILRALSMVVPGTALEFAQLGVGQAWPR